MPRTAREIRLKSRPVGMPAPENFELAEVPIPEPGPGQMLIRTIWMSVDPYMRGRMSDRKSYAPPFEVGKAMDGRFVGEVMESNGGRFPKGTFVAGMGGGWKEYHVADGKGLFQANPDIPLQAHIGTYGMPGMTAYVGLLDIGQPKPGETVLVSAASGAVGAVVCQIAKIKGCRVVGVAGSDEKCAWLKETAGVDGTVNYKHHKGADALEAAIAEYCPDGVDVYFENVGGDHLTAALNLLNQHGRIAACGMIARYNDADPQPGPPNMFLVVGKRIRMQGFIISDHNDRIPDFNRDMAQWIKEGKVKWRETVFEGLERAPEAFMGLFKGENFGKMLVRVGPDRA